MLIYFTIDTVFQPINNIFQLSFSISLPGFIPHIPIAEMWPQNWGWNPLDPPLLSVIGSLGEGITWLANLERSVTFGMRNNFNHQRRCMCVYNIYQCQPIYQCHAILTQLTASVPAQGKYKIARPWVGLNHQPTQQPNALTDCATETSVIPWTVQKQMIEIFSAGARLQARH